MSKLDEILYLHNREPNDRDPRDGLMDSEAKQQIKALVLELIGYGSIDMKYDLEKLSLTEKAELVGRNQLTRELRQKVEEL